MVICFFGKALDVYILTLIYYLYWPSFANCKISLLLNLFRGSASVDFIELNHVFMWFIYWCHCQDWTGMTFENIMDEAEKIRVTVMHCRIIYSSVDLASTMFFSCLKYICVCVFVSSDYGKDFSWCKIVHLSLLYVDRSSYMCEG